MLCPFCRNVFERPDAPAAGFRCPLCDADIEAGTRTDLPDAPTTAITATPPDQEQSNPLLSGVLDVRLTDESGLPFRWRWLILAGYLVGLGGVWAYAWEWDPAEEIAPSHTWFLILVLGLQLYFPLGVLLFRNVDLHLGQPYRPFLPLWAILASTSAVVGALAWTIIFRLPEEVNLSDLVLLLGPSGLFFGTQALFLLGAPVLARPNRRHGKPIWLSLAAGTLCLTLLCCGMVLSLEELFRRTIPFRVFGANSGLMFLGVVWGFWLVLLGGVWRGANWSATFRRMYRLLFGGTCLELLITIPADIQARQRVTCYCCTGTFLALLIGLFMALWLFGPGVLLLFLLRREQRRRRPGFCRECGLDLREWTGSRCPECEAACRPFAMKMPHISTDEAHEKRRR